VPENQGSGTGSSEGEDLFEDLDKFFAPIQDVDWPETTEPAPAPATPDDGRSGALDDLDGDDDPSPFDDPSTTASTTASDQGSLLGGSETPTDTSWTPAAEDDWSSRPATSPQTPTETWSSDAPAGGNAMSDEPAWTAPGDDRTGAGTDDQGGGFLFGEQDDDDLTENTAITEEAFAQTPDAYVDLPQTDPDDAGVAELMEDDVVIDEPPPDLDAVEAAADHFAESVRDEVQLDPNAPAPVAPMPTEEVEIAALLGDDEDADEDEDEDQDEDEQPVAERRTLRVGAEGLGGPSWQEPTTVEIGADSERRGPGRDMPMAFLTGLVLVAAVLVAFVIGPGAFAVVAGIAVLFAQGEFYFALQKRHYQPATALGLVAGAMVLGAGYYRGEGAMLAMVVLGTFVTFLWYMTVPVQHRRNVVSNIALTVLGIVYIPLLAAYAFALLRFVDGRGLVLSILGLTIAYDVAAFGVGYFWGSRPLAPNVSPKKSWEGAIGATLVVIALAVGIVASYVDALDTVGSAVGLAVVIAVFAPLGDLAESVLKRDLGLKDFGSVLPGHGGVLDRIDAMLFVAPAAFLFLRLILL
jgi:phosphatidate cytidylyltransferase